MMISKKPEGERGDRGMEEIKKGDKVKLKFGGASMLVESVKRGVAVCVWQDNLNQPHREEYALDLLEKDIPLPFIPTILGAKRRDK